jgi:diguanylate cyclase (GGDEF)-like protein
LTVNKTQPLLAVIAAAGLLVLTVSMVIRPAAYAQPWQGVTIVLAWVAILASALAARAHQEDIDSLADAPPAPHLAAASPAPSRTAPPRPSVAEAIPTASALVEFAQELHGTLQNDRLRHLIARRLPSIVGRREVWVVARFGTRQHIIVPSEGNAVPPPAMLTDSARQWITFPMKVEGESIGVLGVGLQTGELSEREHRVLTIVAALVGQSLATVNSFEAMREASLVDPLTGCATRAEGLRRFEAELRRADRSRTSLAVLMLDLDHFKNINDRFGHNTGDAVLSAVGEMLMSTLRASDVRCRWGGEEFLLVLPDSSIERARRASEALRQRIASTPVRVGRHAVQVTASIGITLTRLGEADMQKLLGRADAALYHAKSQGRNRIKFVLGDYQGEVVAAPRAPAPAATVTASAAAASNDVPASRDPQRDVPERRDPQRRDRRRIPSPGRRRTDPDVLTGPWRASS